MARRGKHFRPRPPRRRGPLVVSAAVVAVGLVGVVTGVIARSSPAPMPNTVATGTTGTTRINTTGTSTTARPGDPGQTRVRRGSGQAVTLAFGGDVHFEGRIRSQLTADPAGVLAGVAPLLRRADLAVVNLETAITTRGTAAAGKQYTFRAPASALTALAAGGVDVATMANNHGLDYGREGLEDSLEAVRAGPVAVVGIGRDAQEAYRPVVREVKGQRIAVFGATQVLDDDLRAAWTATDTQPGLASAKEVDRLTAAVRAARAQADTIVVYLHWGTEGQTCPNQAQPILARALVEAGADVIVGGHAHRLQGAGRMGSAYVAYGLGNFVFYTDAGPGTETGVLTLSVTGRDIDDARWSPARLVGQLPRPLQGAEAARASAAWDGLRACTGLGL